MMTADGTGTAAAQDDRPPLDALQMALNLAAGVERISEYVSSGPDAELQAHVRGLGAQQAAAAQMAAHLAVVSVAQDARRIADALDRLADRAAGGEPPW